MQIETPIIHTFAFEQLGITDAEIMQAMGYGPEDYDSHIIAQVNSCLQSVPDNLRIEGGCVLYDNVTVYPESGEIFVRNSSFTTGKIVAHEMKNPQYIAVFACTAGEEISHKSKIAISGDPLNGYLFDTIGSEIAERAMDRVQSHLSEHAAAEKMNITNRFSPGYCSWPVSDQHALFALLPNRFCGITLTPSALMQPVKSVSGFIGIGTNVRYRDYQCLLCDMHDCIRRKQRIRQTG
ncbi:MAG: hypothetical protein GF398_03700 [Chitinivibrionales bacterium]|nr:hypothetical protein [Chitinivibrionales bacterium]